MKKISSYLIALALTAFTFASCEDVPAPFGQPINPVEEIAVDPEGSGTQADPYNVAAIIAFTSGLDADTPSKEVYFKGFISQIKDVDTSGSYGNATYYITDDKDGKGNQFYIYRGYGLGGQKFNEPNATIIKVGDEVLLKSKVTNYKGTTPETVQNECIIVELNGKKADGSGGGGDDGGDKPTPTPTPTGDNLLVNGDFETWSQDTYPDNWKTETTAGNATLSKSTDAHTGSASVKLTANSSNKRLGYKEITLKAGTYVTLFYAKGTGDKNASVATGYASIDEANKLTYKYKLGTDDKTEYTEANTSSWKEISNTFTLTEDTKVSIIVMNKGGGGDLLVDDFSLKTSDGGIVDGGGGGTDPQPSGSIGLNVSFASGQGDFTINNKELGSLTYVWNADTKNGYMKASAYSGGAIAAESWLISPAFSLKGVTAPKITFNNACNQVKTGIITDHIHLMVSLDKTNWTEVTMTNLPNGSSWTFVDTTADLTAYANKETVYVAFKYVSTSTIAPTWEIKTVKVE